LRSHAAGSCVYPQVVQVPQVIPCDHLWSVIGVSPLSVGCDECIRAGMRWDKLRICMTCGHVGCCNDSVGKHASAHWLWNPGHPIIRSFEPEEDWWWCFSEGLLFEVKGAPPAPSHNSTPRPWTGWRPPGRGLVVSRFHLRNVNEAVATSFAWTGDDCDEKRVLCL
jgi:hypothetical protein